MTDDPDLFGFVEPPAYPDVPGHRGSLPFPSSSGFIRGISVDGEKHAPEDRALGNARGLEPGRHLARLGSRPDHGPHMPRFHRPAVRSVPPSKSRIVLHDFGLGRRCA
jgi:hypothetical protein